MEHVRSDILRIFHWVTMRMNPCQILVYSYVMELHMLKQRMVIQFTKKIREYQNPKQRLPGCASIPEGYSMLD